MSWARQTNKRDRYLRPDGGQVQLGEPPVELLCADLLLQLVRLVEQVRLEAPGNGDVIKTRTRAKLDVAHETSANIPRKRKQLESSPHSY